MRRHLLILLVLALSCVTAPAVAQVDSGTEPVSEPCAADPDADFVLTPDGVSEVVPTPTLPSPYPLGLGGEPDPLGFQSMATDVYTVQLDLSPDYTRARADVDIDWAHTGDIDLDVRYKSAVAESHSFNPQSGNGESATVGYVTHCETFTVEIRNYISMPGDIDLTMGTSSERV